MLALGRLVRSPTSSSDLGGRAEPAFRERLVVPVWWWPLGLGVGGLLAAELHSGYGGLRAWLPYTLVGLLVVGGLIALSRLEVCVQEGMLQVAGARLPVAMIGAVSALDPGATRRTLGRDGDPAAFVVSRPWLHTAVWVVLDDPDDDTPYWLISTRRPAELVAALDRARGTAGADAG